MERRAFSPLTLFCQALTARKGEGKVLRPKGREGGRKEKFVDEDPTSRDKERDGTAYLCPFISEVGVPTIP